MLKKPKRDSEILEKAAAVFDLPGEVVAGMPRMTITGCRRIFIENHHGILEYGENEIHINGGRVVIKLKGTQLALRSMSDSELLITGQLLGIDFDF